jgi:uncharacterized OB-fold protein
MTYPKPLPDPSSPFWLALRERKLMVQRCDHCHELRYPAAPLCPECLTVGEQWVPIEAVGTLWSYVVYHRALASSFADDVPYAVGLVQLDEGPQIMAGIDAPLDTIKIGNRMIGAFVDVTPEVTLLRWTPAEPVATENA